MPTMVIMRGIPGSGKSTYARNEYYDFKHCSADNFWSEDQSFDPALLPEAHAFCLREVLLALRSGDNVVVDNTHIRSWEYEDYCLIADTFGCVLKIFEMQIQTVRHIQICAGRTIHEVPPAVVARMAIQFQPDEWATKVPIHV